MSYFIHDKGICESTKVGANTKIWAFAHVLPNAVIGEDCNICDGVFIENDVQLGNRVTIKCGVQIWDGIRIEDDVFIGPNATFTNDIFPRSKVYPEKFLSTKVEKGASIGANATILPGITIGQYAMVGAGAVVTKDVPPYAIVTGNPSRITGYVNSEKINENYHSSAVSGGKFSAELSGAKLIELKVVGDMRGDLSVGEFGDINSLKIPFVPKRYFTVFNVPSSKVRGEHAHKECHQFLIAVNGGLSVIVDDGKRRMEFDLNSPGFGLYIPPKIWGVQYKFTSDAVLLVFASDLYDPNDYLRDYSEFLKFVNPV